MYKKTCFTLAEGTPCFENLTCVARRAFTLAEVLIVIGVIGVVAAITIPSLINTISKNAKKAQTEVIEARLLDGINRYSATDDGLSQKHGTTYDFLVGLSAHYKMSQICKADEIEKCIPYAKIYSSDGTDSADVSSLKTIDTLVAGNAADNYLAPASFITAQGTPVIMALKKDCAWDMGTAMRSVEDSGCIVYMYDKNGTGLPNRMGTDIVNYGLSIKGFPLATLGGVKIMTSAFPISTGLSLSECQTEMSKADEYKAINGDVYIKSCENLKSYMTSYIGDRWAYAMKYCKDLGYHLPTEQQLANIANALYTGMQASATDNVWELRYSTNNALIGSNESIPEALSGLGSSWNNIWSGSEDSSANAYNRNFLSSSSSRSNYWRGTSQDTCRAVCVSD